MTTKKIKEEYVDIRDLSCKGVGGGSKSHSANHHQYNEFLVLNLERKPNKTVKDMKESLLASSDYREYNKMPDSPESSKAQLTVNTNTGPAIVVGALNHSHKGPTPLTGMNGSHSPHSTMNGGSPSSPTTSLGSTGGGGGGNSTASAELPSTCNVRQLSKLKRFLTTLQQFGSDISPEIGERVRNLILNLVNGTLTIEEFHHKLQETTNFPLRPFVVPFLKTNLPLLQRELIQGARLAKQSPQQYLRQHEHLVLDPSHSPTEASDIFHSEINENGKRRTPDSLTQHSARMKENGSVESSMDIVPPPKRHHPLMSPPIPTRMSPAGIALHPAAPIRLEDVALCRDIRDRDRDRDRYEREYRHYGLPLRDMLDEREMEDEWKNIHTMLNCILGMVEKTKRALAILQHRSLTDRHEMAMWIRRHTEGTEHDMKKRAGEMMAHTLKTTEDRVSEVKRRAEEAVNEVKRQAVVELQKAVSAAEAKASELVAAERAKMEKLIMDARRQAAEEALTAINRQEESTESCWNCGRKANETCSGCNVARYCGAFCQHKDWENHHHVCGQAQAANFSVSVASSSSPASAVVSAAPQAPTEGRVSNNASPSGAAASMTPSPPAVTSRSGSRSGTPVDTKPVSETKH